MLTFVIMTYDPQLELDEFEAMIKKDWPEAGTTTIIKTDDRPVSALSKEEKIALAINSQKEWETYWRHRGRSASFRFRPGQPLSADSLLTVIGPGYENRYGRMTWQVVLCLCDPARGGCGNRAEVPYYAAYQANGKYSCGCRRRPRKDRVDYAGIGIVAPDGRTLTLIYEDPHPRTGGWVYVCDHCAKTGVLARGDRGAGGAVLQKLKAVARRPCRL